MGNYSYIVYNDWNTEEVRLTIENTDKCDGPVTIGLSAREARKLAVQILQHAQGAEDNQRSNK
jgi:hypothetical protein